MDQAADDADGVCFARLSTQQKAENISRRFNSGSALKRRLQTCVQLGGWCGCGLPRFNCCKIWADSRGM